MDTERWQRIQTLFTAIETMDSRAQIEYLEQNCAESDIRNEVLSLLKADQKADQFFKPINTSNPEQNHLDPGTLIGPYRIESLIGEGGMGAVYKAEDTRLHRSVALKFLSPKQLNRESGQERFLIEARAASRLDHVNICTIYDIGETTSGQPYIAMGYYPGDLLDRQFRQKNPTLRQTLDIIAQILNGVQAAHQHDIYHRDLKPANIILTQNNVVKILDFGIAKMRGVDITTTGSQIGTIAYMSPEQLQGNEAHQQSDIWSCGVIFYELLTGTRPFKGKEHHQVMYSIVQGTHEPITKLNPDLPEELQNIIDRMLCHDLQLRYPSAQAVLNDLLLLKQNSSDLNDIANLDNAFVDTDTHTYQSENTNSTTTIFTSDGDLRQATVMSIDLSNYSGILQTEGPEKTKLIVRQFFNMIGDVIKSYGGTVNREIDNTIIAIFGVPVAHDNDAQRAVLAAIACHTIVVQLGQSFNITLSAHIGIANGIILMNTSNDNAGQQYIVTGDSLTLATRLDDLAQNGETIISNSLYLIINNQFDCEHRGSVNVRYQQDPIKVWRILSNQQTNTENKLALVGRSSELQQFTHILNSTQKGNSGNVIYICGEAGIGKTRLATECKQLASQQGYDTHHGLILDFGVTEGQDAIALVVRSILSLAIDTKLENTLDQIQQHISNGSIAEDQLIYLNELLGLPQNTEQRRLFDLMDHSARLQGLHNLVASLIVQQAQQQPILILIEDLHWADPNTLDCITNIAANTHQVPVILLLTTRPENEPLTPAWRSSMNNIPLVSFYLSALQEQDAIDMARQMLGNNNKDYMALVDRAQGNPLFLEQLIRSDASINDSSQLPASLQSLVQSQLDKLSLADKHAARAASIIGQRFNAEQLRFLLDDPDYDCQQLVKHQLTHLRGDAYLFNHALIHEGIYASLLDTHKQELHHRAAEWFSEHDKSLAAEHLDRAESPIATEAYINAAEEQKQQYHFDKAIRLLERAAQIANTQKQKYDLNALLGEVLTDKGQIADAAEAYSLAIASASDDKQRCRAWIGLAQGYDINDEHEQAFSALDKAEAAAQNLDLTIELAQIHYQRGNLYFPRGDIQACKDEHQLAIKFAQQADSPQHEAQALSGLGDAEYAAGHMLSAHDYFNRCIALCNQYGYARIESANRFMLGTVRIYLNELTGALEDSLTSANTASQVGHVRAEIVSRLTAGWIYLDQMKLDDAMHQVQLGLDLTEQLGAKRFEPFLNETKARILITQGKMTQALAVAEQAMDITRQTGMQFIGPWILGTIALASDEATTHQAALKEGLSLLEQGCVGHNYYQFYRAAIEVSLQTEDWDGAERYCDLLEEYTQAEPNPWAKFHLQWGRTLAAAGKSPDQTNIKEQLLALKQQAQQVGFLARITLIDKTLKQLTPLSPTET